MISVIGIEERMKWDDIVRSFRDYDVNYLNGYARAFRVHGEGEPMLVYYDDGDTRAINVVMKRDIALSPAFSGKLPSGIYYDLSTPYGYGGFWIEGEGKRAVNEAYDAYCKEVGYVSEFVRFHLYGDCKDCFNGAVETHAHNIVRDLDLSFEQIEKDFEHKVRTNIRRACSSGLEIEFDPEGKRIDDFLQIYYETMDRTGAEKDFYFSKEFFNELNGMKDQHVFIHVLYENKVISSELILYGTENCYPFLCGTRQEYFHLRPYDYLKYESFKWAKEKGLKRAILGGGYGCDDGIYKFKKSFAPHGIYDYYIGKKIFNQEAYDRLVNLRCDGHPESFQTGYFPAYRG
jgi:hypothetical protein